METFLAVCRLGSYTRAAEELNITQPAVTQHIQHLQTYYGVRLLDYRSKRLTLTPEGELLRRAALTMRHDEEKLKRELADLRQGRRALRFGATLTVGEYLLPPRLAAYLKANPDVELHMTVDNTRNLLQKLNAGELDFAVVEGYFRKSEYDYIVWSLEEFLCVCGADSPFAVVEGYFRKSEYDYIVWSLEEFLCVCGADSPLAGAPARPLDALFGETLLLRSPGSGSRDVLERVLEERNHRVEDFRRVVEISDLYVIKELVKAGCGITFLYRRAVEAELAAGTLYPAALTDCALAHEFTFLWRKDSAFEAELREVSRQLWGEGR